MKKAAIIIIAILCSIGSYAQDWVDSDLTGGLGIALDYTDETYYVMFDIQTMPATLDQYSDIELFFVNGIEPVPYHFNQSEIVDLRYDVLILPLTLSNFMGISKGQGIEYLAINNVRFSLSETDRGKMSEIVKKGL